MSWLRVNRALTVCSLNLWRNSSSWPVQVHHRYRVFNHVIVRSWTGLNIPFLLAGLNVDVFSLPWQPERYVSTSVGQGGERNQRRFDIDTPEFVQIVNEHNKCVERLVIDVREPEELTESGQIPGTVNIPLGEVEGALCAIPDIFRKRYGINKPSQDTDIIFHCRSGVRSLAAIDIANKLGYSKSRHYMRGYLGWQEHMQSQSE